MKFIFTADWHIKLGAKNVPKDWQLDRFYRLFDAINKESVDLVIVGGDIFDKMPNLEELDLYYKFVHSTNKETVIFDGNHEATRKGKTFLSVLKEVTSMINPGVTVVDSSQRNYKGYGFDIIPYCELKTFDPDSFDSPLLMTHVRGEIRPHVTPEIDLDKLERWDTVFAGDLHSYENSQRNILYPGSPMTITFHRNNVATGYLIYDTETKKVSRKVLKMPQLIRKTIEAGEAPDTNESFHHVIYEVVGNISELKNINIDESLLDKKIVSVAANATLNLENMSIREELEEYLIEILGIQGETLESVLGVFNDYDD